MSQSISKSIPVHIVLPEMLMALGIRAALCTHAMLDVRILPVRDGDVPVVKDGVVVTNYHHGLQLVRRARADARTVGASAVHVLVMSARDREHEIRFALEEGVRGYLPVSCPPPELTEAVLSLSRGRRHLSAVAAARMADSLGRESLTLREQQVLALLACGECNKLIARQLHITIGTVKSHVKSIMHKLDASSRAKAVSIASARGLIEIAGLMAASECPDQDMHFA